MWPEIETAKNEKRRELVLSGLQISERIQKDRLDASLYGLKDLNYLSLTDTCLSELGSDIGQLSNLQILILHSNSLTELSEGIAKLTKLKILDVSCNNIKAVSGDLLASLPLIQTLNFSNNIIESPPLLVNNTKLTVLDLSNNKLQLFPDICKAELVCLSELKLQSNEIEHIPNSISLLPALKFLDISFNKITSLPSELADCSKLKEVNLKSNPISERRLLKLIDQCGTKQILDYVRQHCSKSVPNNEPSKKGNKKKDKKSPRVDSEESQSTENENNYKFNITIKQLDDNFKVEVDSSTKSIREHIVCCVIRNVLFSENSFKEFIKMQNKLHDGICGKRNNATIATHNFEQLGSRVIKYTTYLPKDLKIIPLNEIVEMTGAELFTKLKMEADNLRKEKKRNTYSGIHKYLYLVEGKPTYPCLVNDQNKVISFPPITNADITKIDPKTTNIFVEVTSSVSQMICKTVLTNLLKDAVNLLGPNLEVQQVKIVDQDDKLKLIFPAKNDLKFAEEFAIKVNRE